MASSSCSVDNSCNLTPLMMARLDLIWEMGEASLSSNGDEIRIPLHISRKLGQTEIAELERRLSARLNDAHTFHFEDDEIGVMRIFALTPSPVDLGTPDTSDDAFALNVAPSSTSNDISPAAITASYQATTQKVRRPPNAFILYRQQWHPRIKEQNPDMRNTTISVLLGKQWKAESSTVKQLFKDMAQRIKLQHAVDNPGYQYKPRKSSDRKRRATSEKRAEQLETSENVTTSDSDFPDELFIPEFADYSALRVSNIYGQTPLPTPEGIPGIARPADNASPPVVANTTTEHTLPTNYDVSLVHSQVAEQEQAVNAQLPQQQQTASVQESITTDVPEHVQAAEEWYHSLINPLALNGLQSIQNATLNQMAELDEHDANMPHLEPFDNLTFVEIEQRRLNPGNAS